MKITMKIVAILCYTTGLALVIAGIILVYLRI